jgi:hypothetical protein
MKILWQLLFYTVFFIGLYFESKFWYAFSFCLILFGVNEICGAIDILSDRIKKLEGNDEEL